MKFSDRKDLVHCLNQVDAHVAGWMARNGVKCLRVSLGVVFVWFGGLKLFPGLSPAEGLAGSTIALLTFGLVGPSASVPVLGIGETLIGIGLMSGKALRLTLVALFAHMVGTVTPLLLLPAVVFVREPFVLTMEGQYIIKNLVFVSAAIVVGATVRGGRLKSEPTGEYRRLTQPGLIRPHDHLTTTPLHFPLQARHTLG